MNREKRKYECCRLEENMVVKVEAEDSICEVCRVCNRRHFVQICEPGRLGLKFS